MESPLLLLVWPALFLLLPLASDRDAPWSTPVDLSLALGLGLATAAIKAWAAPLMMMEPVTGSDPAAACVTTHAVATLELWRAHRPTVGAVLPAALSGWLGTLDGVLVASWIFAAVQGAAVYLWARTLAGRAAGVSAAVLSCAVAPLAMMTRHFSFYPMAAASYALCAAGAMAALRWRTLPALAAAGCGLGLALAADHPGLLYALPMGCAALVAAALAPAADTSRRWAARRRIPLRLALVLGPVLLSWIGTRLITPPTIGAFERKVIAYMGDSVGHLRNPHQQSDDGFTGTLARWAIPADQFEPADRGHQGGYRWGHAGPVQVARTLTALGLLATLPRESGPRTFGARNMKWDNVRQVQMDPWLPLYGVGLLITLWALRRRPLELAGLLMVLLPFVVMLATQARSQLYPRFLMAPLAPAAVVMGVALAWPCWPRGKVKDGAGDGLLGKLLSARDALLGRRLQWLRTALAGALCVVLVTGILPGWLSPVASWREPYPTAPLQSDFGGGAQNEPERCTAGPGHCLANCNAVHQYDIKLGFPACSRIYPEALQGCGGEERPRRPPRRP